ncbi:T9SS type A sorting domain-containing protein [Kaistella soli]|uniref:T9SS type A sorting domain-containing protein n=1 Tax=Kaistella soli TaxID=2849654 RepID=UPI001FE45A28|nr:T9SS type A sorting domain-containing protein [Kaistella soli]
MFEVSDKIILGSRHFAAGNYTFTLDKAEGVFANGQHIYLKDKQTGIITNLSEGSYTFAANAGESTGRFEIIYQSETVLATDGTVKDDLLVYRDGDDFVIDSKGKKITQVEVYDSSGRLSLKTEPGSMKTVIPAVSLSNGVYILKINQAGKITNRKIIR